MRRIGARRGNKNVFITIKRGTKTVVSLVKTPHIHTHSCKRLGSAACPYITQLPFGGDILQIIHNAAAHLDLNLPERSLVTNLLPSLRLPAAVYIKFKGCWGMHLHSFRPWCSPALCPALDYYQALSSAFLNSAFLSLQPDLAHVFIIF